MISGRSSDRDCTAFDVVPMTRYLGADVRGVDITTLPNAGFTELRRALIRYRLLALREQSLTVEQLHDFARRLGPFSGNPIHQPVGDDFPDIVKVTRAADDPSPVFGAGWHMDLAWFERPPATTLLYVEECPTVGGDTLFSDLEQAHAGLSEKMRSLLANLSAMHRGHRSFAINAALNSINVRPEGFAESQVERTHPLVCSNPDTNQPYLFISNSASGIEGLHPAEAKALLDFLFDHAIQAQFTARLCWQPGTLALWQNSQLLHNAIDDYRGHRRVAYRTTVAGSVPHAFAPA